MKTFSTIQTSGFNNELYIRSVRSAAFQRRVPLHYEAKERTYLTEELKNSPSTLIFLPTLSFARQISVYARTVAIVIQRVSYAMMPSVCPGTQRPKPNATSLESRILGLSMPSMRNRSGLKVSGLGYTLSSWRIDLLNSPSDQIQRRGMNGDWGRDQGVFLQMVPVVNVVLW